MGKLTPKKFEEACASIHGSIMECSTKIHDTYKDKVSVPEYLCMHLMVLMDLIYRASPNIAEGNNLIQHVWDGQMETMRQTIPEEHRHEFDKE